MKDALLVGSLLAILSGLMNGSFTLPMRFLGRWEWENVWSLFIVGSFFAGVVVGYLHPSDPEAAGRMVGEIAALPIMVGSLGFSIWLTAIGKLPGTQK